jgi:hypothetical protein
MPALHFFFRLAYLYAGCSSAQSPYDRRSRGTAICVAHEDHSGRLFGAGSGKERMRSLCMGKAADLTGDSGTMPAVHAACEAVAPLMDSSAGVFVLNVNSPTQTVIGGSTDATLSAAETPSAKGHRWNRLPVGTRWIFYPFVCRRSGSYRQSDSRPPISAGYAAAQEVTWKRRETGAAH